MNIMFKCQYSDGGIILLYTFKPSSILYVYIYQFDFHTSDIFPTQNAPYTRYKKMKNNISSTILSSSPYENEPDINETVLIEVITVLYNYQLTTKNIYITKRILVTEARLYRLEVSECCKQ